MKNKKRSIQEQKNFNKKLQKSSRLFMLIGLTLSLFLVHVFIEYETKKINSISLEIDPLEEDQIYYTSKVFEKEKLVKNSPNSKKEEVKPQETKILDEIKVDSTNQKIAEDLFVEPILEDNSNIDALVEYKVPEKIVEENFSVLTVEQVPVYPGCSGTQDELKQCLEKKIKKHISRKFDPSVADKVGLVSGKKRINVMFTIDKTGHVSDVKTRAPHPALKKEAEKTINSLPVMKPGKQGQKSVGVKYGIPIVFEVM